MKYTITYLLLCLFLFTSCLRDDSSQFCDGQVPISVLLTSRGVPYINDPTNDNCIVSIRIYAFNEDGSLEKMKLFSNNPVLSENPQILVKTGKKILYAIVNEPADIKTKLEVASSPSELEAIVATYTSCPTIPLLMSGKTEISVFGAKGQKTIINVVRASARIDVIVKKDETAIPSNVIIDNIETIFCNNKVKLFGANIDDDPADAIYNISTNYATNATVTNNITPTLLKSVYVLPHATQKSTPTAINITYTKEGRQQTKVIPIRKDGDATEILNPRVRRNMKYTITITFTGTTVNINITMMPWTLNSDAANIHVVNTNDLANCYLLPPSSGNVRNAILFPVAQANADDYGNRITDTDELTAELVWTDVIATTAPNTGKGLADDTPISSIAVIGKGTSAKIQVISGSKEGNAVVCVKKAGSPTVLWSWHIWVTNYDPEMNFDTNPETELPFMTYNLGAINSNSYGLYYQWGRKDPFVRPQTTAPYDAPKNIIDALGNHVRQEYQSSNTNTITIGYAASFPTLFLQTYGASNWTFENDTTLWNSLASKKTPYDPCPAGWRVPRATEFGKNYRPEYPISGYFNGNKGDQRYPSTPKDNPMWTASPAGPTNTASFYNFSLAYTPNRTGLSNTWRETAVRTKALNIRCVRDIMSPISPITIAWKDGPINLQSSTPNERARNKFTVSIENAVAPLSYQWWINGKKGPNTAEYTNIVNTYGNQSFFLQCQVTDALGRTARTSNEWILMKRPFKDPTMIATMQNSNNYLRLAKEQITTNGGSRVRYLRDTRDNNIYRVKLMGDGRWWMVSNLCYEIPGYKSEPAGTGAYYYLDSKFTPEGSCIYRREAALGRLSNKEETILCPNGWYLPSQAEYEKLFPKIPTDGAILDRSSNDGALMLEYMFGTDETKANSFEAILTGWATGSALELYAIHLWTTSTNTWAIYLLRYHIPVYNYSIGFDFYRISNDTDDRFPVRCIKKQ